MKKKGILRIFAAAALIIAAFLLPAGCGRFGGEKAESEETQEEAVTVFAVNTVRAVRGQIQDYISLSGDVVSRTSVDAFPDTMGRVTDIKVSVGDRVVKDQVIAEIDPSRPGQRFELSPVKAPIDGTVIAVPGQIGSTVSQQVSIARIGKMDDLEVRTYVAERFISRMRVGLTVELTFEAYPGLIFRGRIRELSPVLDPASRTMEIKLSVTGRRDAQLKAGMFSQIKVITEEKGDVVKLPAEAVVRRFGEDYAFVVTDDPENPELKRAERRLVSLGIRIDNMVEVTGGVAADEEVVVRGQTLLEDGSRVNVIDRRRING